MRPASRASSGPGNRPRIWPPSWWAPGSSSPPRPATKGRLYGSISVQDVVEGIKRFTGLELERDTVVLPSPIKAIGLHEIQIKLHPEVEFPLTLDVIPAS